MKSLECVATCGELKDLKREGWELKFENSAGTKPAFLEKELPAWLSTKVICQAPCQSSHHVLTLFTMTKAWTRGKDIWNTERAGISRQAEALLWLDLLCPGYIRRSLESSMHTLQVMNYLGK